MAINFIKKEDLSHITRTTRQWETTIDRYEIIPKGVLCIELCNDKLTKIKIGNGHLIYEQLPYVSDVNLSDYYTKEETNNLIKDLKAIKIKGEASSLSDLPSRGNEEGDLWFVKKQDPDTHSRYDEYVWYNNKWESFGSSDIDLSEYAKKSYVDTHIQEVQNEITEIIESGYLHKHDNKNILDHTSAVYNVEKDNKLRDLHNYDDTELREKAHTHLNKNILDQTDAVYNRDKDDKLSGLHNYDDTDVKDRISNLEGVAHSHSNQDILDRTTAAFTKEQALTLLDCKDFEGTDGVHDGHHGFVPAPTAADVGKVLGANGQWVEGGGTGGDVVTQGGGIEITTDSQTGVKTVSVNAGTGLDIDQQTGELYVTSTGGDTIAEGSGIDITTDSQTGVKTISVDIGNGLQFNQNSEIEVSTGDGLSINQDNELEVSLGNGLQFDSNNEIEINTGDGLSINNDNELELDKATTTTIGGVIVGDGLSVDQNGELSVNTGDGLTINQDNEVEVAVGDGIVIDENGAVALEEQPKEYHAGEAISIETVGGLQLTDYSNDDFVTSIASMNAGSIVKAADNSSFTLTASSNDCYTRGWDAQANGSYPYNVKASTKYRFAWDSANPTVHGKVYTYENAQYGDMMHEIDQYDSSYLEFTTSANTTFIQARFGVMYAGDSITYSNVRLYEFIEDEDAYDEISVKHGDGLTVNNRNELEVNYGNGLDIVSNSQYRSKYYFNTQVQCQVHTDNPASGTPSNRTYQKTTTEPALCCIWEVGDGGALWTGPLLVGTTATSVQYTTADTQQTVTYQNTFQYLGQTWYTSGYPDFLNAADHEDKLGNLQYLGSYAAVTDQIQAAKDLINLALINAGSLQAKIGAGLHFNENNAIEADEIDIDTYEPGNGISFIRHYARDLPVGYTQLEYIESHFDAGFILDYYPQKTSKIVCEAAYVDFNRSSPSDNCLFGSRNGNSSSSKQFVFWFNNKTSDPCYVGFVYSGNTWGEIGEHYTYANMHQRLLFEISPSIGVYCNNVLIQNPLSHPTYDPSPYKLGILCLATSDAGIDTTRNYQSGRIFTFKIYESDTLVVDLVPCLNDSDVPGLYDMVNEVFYTSASGTDFTYDPDAVVTHDSITIDANRGSGIIYENNALSLNPGSGLSIDETDNQKLNVNLADGLSIKNTSTNAIKINTGDGLSIDSTTNKLNVNIGDGLVKDSSNNIVINNNSDFYINTNNQFCINPLYAPTYEAGNGVQFVSTSPYNLPPNYTKLSCVESKNSVTDKSAFRLNYVPTTETKFDVLFGITKAGFTDVTIIGSGGTNTAKYSLNITRSSSAATNNTTVRFNYCQDSSSTSVSFTTAIGDILHIVADKNGVYVNNNLVQTPVQTGSPSSYKLCVGSSPATNDATSFRDPSTPGKYYDIKIYEGSTLTVHLIPCLNDSNVPGMYDEVNELFHHNEWKTDFHYDENEKTRPGYYVQAKLGNGLQFDANNAIEVVNGGTEYTAGDGIDINASDEISVKIGNHLSFDQTTGEINVDDIIEYTAGDGIAITLVDDIDVFNNGDGWENLCYSDSTGNSTTGNYQWEIHSPISNSLTIPQGATQIKAVAKDTNDNLIWTSFSWIDSNDYHFTSTSPNDGHYDDWFNIPSGSVKVNFGVRWTRLSTSQAISTSDVDSVTVMFDNGDTKRIDVNVGDGLFIDSTNNDVNVKIGQALSINNSNEIDVNLGRALSINNNNEIDVDIATATSLGVVKAGSGLNIDEFGNLSTQATPFRIGRALSLDDESVRLPSAYAKAKYVANTSNAAVRISFRPSDYPNAKYVSSVSLDSCGSSSTYPTRYLCGASGWTGSLQIPLDGVSGGLPIKTRFHIGNGNYPEYTSTAFQFGDRFDIEASVLGGYKINNEVVQASATPPSNFGTYYLAIFGSGASNGPGEPGFIGKMYYFRIYNSDDTLLCNLVPAVRRTDNVVGFYDMVGNQFYPSETSTGFTTDMDDLDVDDPDWVLNAKIATSNSLGVVKPSTGLVVNEHGALTLDKASASTIGGVKVGNNLSIDSNGVLSANVINYSSGHAIEIVGDLSIDKFRWEITKNAGDSMVAFRYFEYSDSTHIPFTIQAGTIEWSDGSTVSYPSGYDETFAGMMENRTKCTVIDWTGNKTLIMTFRLSQSIMLSDIAYFRWKTDDYMSGRQPQEFNIYAHDSINDEWILLKEVTDHALTPSSSNTWSTYIDIEPEIEPGAINVKYGNGLTLNQNNELEVPVASSSTLGGVIVGNGLTVTSDGTISTATGKTYIAGEGINMSASPYEFSAENEQYLFRSQVTCELHGNVNREFQKYTDDTALGMVWNEYDSGTLWSGPLFVGLSADAVKYTANSTTYSALGTFSYLGKTWYYSNTQMYVSNIDGTDYDGNMVVDTETYASPSDIVQACKSLIDRARVILKVDEISLLPAAEDTLGGIKIGEGLSIDENNVVSSTVYEEGQGITFETSGSSDSFDVKNKEYYFEEIVSCRIDGFTRTYTRTSSEPAILAIVQATASNKVWTSLACISLTANGCKYSNSYDSTIIGPNASFDYKGYTWYIAYDYGVLGSTGVDQLGNVQGPIDLTSIDLTGQQNYDLLGKALIDLAELISPGIKTYDVWGDGTGWLNGAYDNSQSDYFWTNWYYTYHSKQDEYLEVPAGAIKMRLIGISNENDSRLQGGDVDCFNSSHHHFASVECMTDEWADIPEGTVYLQFGVKWNELNDRTISSSDIKSVTLEIKVPKNNAITAKLGDGLTFDENDAITLDESIKLIIHCVGTPLT